MDRAQVQRRFGPIAIDWTITLSDILTLAGAAILALSVYFKLEGEVRSVSEDHKHTKEQVLDIKRRTDKIETDIATELKTIRSQLDQLIGREAARNEKK